ncbi:serine/threonine protein kinase [Gynuella sp.]|uniref:serine/threonine protein kinase n=1 Tax=Gynuella sp. TaxID=2969146 RepID=UPI003D11DC15
MHKPFANLTPDLMLDMLELGGFIVDGRLTALNSYENRVMLVGIEEQPEIVAKFYRPERWSNEQILEEHAFTQRLLDAEVEVVAPQEFTQTQHCIASTLIEHEGYRLAVFPKRWGQPIELDNLDQLEMIGRVLGRLHAVGMDETFEHRITFTPEKFGWQARQICLQSDMIPLELMPAYESVSEQLLDKIDRQWRSSEIFNISLHGDFHPGNILIRDEQPLLVDFDDCVSGPAIQDIWMLLSGDHELQLQQLARIAKGYSMFCHFPMSELGLIECCRSLRMIHYAAWLSSRWNDPAFPRAFPWFESPRFWSDHILQLREQLAAMDLPAPSLTHLL